MFINIVWFCWLFQERNEYISPFDRWLRSRAWSVWILTDLKLTNHSLPCNNFTISQQIEFENISCLELLHLSFHCLFLKNYINLEYDLCHEANALPLPLPHDPLWGGGYPRGHHVYKINFRSRFHKLWKKSAHAFSLWKKVRRILVQHFETLWFALIRCGISSDIGIIANKRNIGTYRL